jgi:hypothetical protein
MSTLNVNRIVDASGGVMAPISSVFKNRIINGAMVIDQRNAGAVVSTDGAFSADRWRLSINNGTNTLQQAVLPSGAVAGFTNYLAFGGAGTALTIGAYNSFSQAIEGFNTADLSWGSANAKTITISFWVNTTGVTGTFGISLRNSAANRSYIGSYTVPTAGVWQYVSITVAGDTAGTWLTNNGVGLYLAFDCGVGATFSTTAGSWQTGNYLGLTGGTKVSATAGAYLNITGVQLEVGTQATSFEYRQYQQELALCQRYYEVYKNTSITIGLLSSVLVGTNSNWAMWQFQVTKRANPTVAEASTSGWVNSTPLIYASVDNANFSGTNYFYSSGTAGTNSLFASAEL